MNRLLTTSLALVAVGGGAWFLVPDDGQTLSPEHVPSLVRSEANEAPASVTDLTVLTPALESERVPVEISEPELATEDPCASVQAELNTVLALFNEQSKTIAELNEKLVKTMLERDRFMYADDTPYGAFLSSYEADEINDPNALVRIEDWLQQFPVFLSAGEATWIAERTGSSCFSAPPVW
jgi:hypothetical protein